MATNADVRTQSSSLQERVAAHIRQVGLDAERFIDVNDGGKGSTVDHTKEENRHGPRRTSGSYGVYAGDGLVFLDVDKSGTEMDGMAHRALQSFPETLRVETPHTTDEIGGHHYYRVVPGDDFETVQEACEGVWGTLNPSPSWGEVRAHNQYVVGPGSELDGCDKEWCGECSTADGGHYELDDRPVAAITADELADALRADPDCPGDNGPDTSEPSSDWAVSVSAFDYSESDVGAVEAAIREFRADDHTEPRAFESLMDLAQGRYEKRGFSDDRSDAEYNLCGLLFGVLRTAGYDMERSIELMYAAISEYCENHRTTDDRQIRKWVERDDAYRMATIRNAVDGFQLDTWERWQRSSEGGNRYTGEYSTTTYDTVMSAVRTAYDDRPGYPVRDDVLDVAQSLDPSRSSGSHRNALRRLQSDHGQVKMAYLGVNDYVYYPASEPDPPSAEWIKLNGEKHDPGEAT